MLRLDTTTPSGRLQFQIIAAPAGVEFATLAAGSAHICGVRAGDGQVQCWGNSMFNRTLAPDGVEFTTLAAGGTYTCGLRAVDATEVCWGTLARNLWRPW